MEDIWLLEDFRNAVWQHVEMAMASEAMQGLDIDCPRWGPAESLFPDSYEQLWLLTQSRGSQAPPSHGGRWVTLW